MARRTALRVSEFDFMHALGAALSARGRATRTPEQWLELAREQRARFESKIDKAGPIAGADGPCWLWTCGKDKDGYGKFAISAPAGERPKQKHVRAHRLAWELENGPVPCGLVLLHACDVTACVRPSHLRPGTQGENRADCIAKGRDPTAYLTPELVSQIRAKRIAGLSYQRIADALGLGLGAVSGAASGRTWRYLE